MKLLSCINITRALVLLISVFAILCHISQCFLFNSYQSKMKIPDWLTTGHWQYLVWYICLSFSLVGSLIVCLNAIYFRRFSVDKYVAPVSFLFVLISVIAILTSGSLEPWTNGKTNGLGGQILTNCDVFDASKDEATSLLHSRCILTNATQISGILLCLVWLGLSGLGVFAAGRHGDKPNLGRNAIHPAVKEPVWGRYIPDPPSSIYSATIVDNRSGLLTPSSALTKDRHVEFYSNCSSIYKEKTPFDYKGDPYNTSKSSSYYYDSDKTNKDYDDKSKVRDLPLLRVSTSFQSNNGNSSPSLSSGLESTSTVTATPLYEKFSKSTFDFDSPSKYYNSRW